MTSPVVTCGNSVDDLEELALEAAERLTRRLVLHELALVMVALSNVHRLDARGEVEQAV